MIEKNKKIQQDKKVTYDVKVAEVRSPSKNRVPDSTPRGSATMS